jgi:hypothetical protein
MANDSSPTADRPERPKFKLRRYQYSLRSLMDFVTLFACACSWLGVKLHEAREQEYAVERLRKLG